jgi:hypothetical protein
MAYPIDRRSLLAGAAMSGVAVATVEAQPRDAAAKLEIYELRTYRLVNGPMKDRLDAYLRNAFIPAARRAGCGPVGVFTVAIGSASPTVHVVVPYSSIEDFVALPGRLTADPSYTIRVPRGEADARVPSLSSSRIDRRLEQQHGAHIRTQDVFQP